MVGVDFFDVRGFEEEGEDKMKTYQAIKLNYSKLSNVTKSFFIGIFSCLIGFWLALYFGGYVIALLFYTSSIAISLIFIVKFFPDKLLKSND